MRLTGSLLSTIKTFINSPFTTLIFVSQATFSLSQKGVFTIDSGALSLLSLDTFHGLQRMNVIAPL